MKFNINCQDWRADLQYKIAPFSTCRVRNVATLVKGIQYFYAPHKIILGQEHSALES